MPYYNVEGADSKTGKDRIEMVIAENEKEAEQLAQSKGLLVSNVYAAIAANASPDGDAPLSPRTFLPFYYADAESGAKYIKFQADGYRIIGWVLIFLGAITGMVVIVLGRTPNESIGGIGIFVAFAVGALFCFGYSRLIRTLAAIVLIIRDIGEQVRRK